MLLRPSLRFLTVLLVASTGLVLAGRAQAFDCTSLGTLANNGTMTMGVIGDASVPGELVCGTDYTGWAFHVYEITVAGPSLQAFGLTTSDGDPFSGFSPYAELLLFNQCDPNACLFQFTTASGNATSDPICLAAGTYTVVVASQDVAPGNIYGVATITAAPCEPVSAGAPSWGTLKSTF